MKTEEIIVFVNGATRFFDKYTQENGIVNPPYLKEGDLPFQDYTGMITVTGRHKGIVYFTAPEVMLIDLWKMMLPKQADETLKTLSAIISSEEKENSLRTKFQSISLDIVGEIANTIAGNSRSEFGEYFHISVPIRMQGLPENLSFSPTGKVYIIPIQWRSHRAYQIVSLE